MKTRITITRHGEGEHNLRTGVFMGRAPEARLTAKGREQAERLGRRLAAGTVPQRIICSSLVRAVETAEIIGRIVGVGDVHGDDAFWELSKGNWEGRMQRPLPPEVQQTVDADPMGFCYGGGESYSDVLARVAPRFEHWVARHGGEALLFVLHGDVIRALLYHLIRFPAARIGDFEIAPCSLTELERNGSRTVIHRINDQAHLS